MNGSQQTEHTLLPEAMMTHAFLCLNMLHNGAQKQHMFVSLHTPTFVKPFGQYWGLVTSHRIKHFSQYGSIYCQLIVNCPLATNRTQFNVISFKI